MTTTTTPPGAPGACTDVQDEAIQEFEAEFHDGPPAIAVAILITVFMLGMFLGAYLEWLR